jgi:hypothetical protein
VSGLPFIPARLDDAWLRPSEFRVFCHLSRRCGDNGAWPSLDTIASKCRLERKTVVRCLAQLVALGFLEKEKRIGETNVYTTTALDKWTPEPNPIGTPTQSAPQVAKRVGRQPKRHPGGVTQSAPHEGYPLKGIQRRNGFSSQKTTEEIYQQYPKKVAKPAALRAITTALKSNDAAMLLEKTIAFSKLWGSDLKFCPNPATWFNGERYNDDPSTWGGKPKPSETIFECLR